ncbi:hypothetical protein [Streptomyces sp. NRRL B-24484]|uniref:hypothetical protein n=1 Tax=Streptomyces sp. NRRL B-24484 TaxID=1463833 RepID=UPI0004C21069|nr:hypothetical protein [Streptomyces sp. NRRL B-24484]
MIPAGHLPADDETAAGLFGLSVSRYRANKTWEQFPTTVKPLQRQGAKARIYDLAQLTVVARNAKATKEAAKKGEVAFQEEIPLISRDPQILVAGAAVPTLKDDVELQAGDLLDRDEAYAAIPEANRPAFSTWLRMIAPPSGGAKTEGPEPTQILSGNNRLWSYGAILDWNSKRTPVHATGHGYHRPKGTKETKPRAHVVARTEETRRLLAENPGLTNEDLAARLEVSVRTAEKYRAAAEEL